MTSNTLFTIRERELKLHRYPEQQKTRSLQAWDSADELLINHICDNYDYETHTRILLINDNFGALACYFANANCSAVNDSWISHLAIALNLTKNNIPQQQVTLISPLEIDKLNPETPFDIVLLKVPKQLDALKALLSSILPFINEQTIFVGAGKAKDIHSSTLNVFASCFTEVTTSLATKKSRLIFAKTPKAPAHKEYAAQTSQFLLEHLQAEITNLPHVFSGKQLDIGARAIIPHLPHTEEKARIVDLGCGNGVLGLTLLQQCPNAEIYFVDESFSAVETARINVQRLFPDDVHRCHFATNNCLDGFSVSEFDWVICNPPFHQQSAITDHIAWQMFVDARKTLNQTGKLLVVGNTHLGYQHKLKRLFSKVIKLEQTKKFMILLGEQK